MTIRNVLVTGVAGFIGSNLLDYLLDHTDWKIDGVDNISTGSMENIEHRLRDKRFSFEKKSCLDLKTLKPYDCLFHLAALPRIQPSFELINEHIEANLLGSTYLLELMIKEKHYPRLVYSGSSAIYGTPKNTPTTEEERPAALSPYAFQKYEVEEYLTFVSQRYPIDYVTLRYFNPYGPRSFNPKNPFNAYSSVVGIFLNRFQEGKALQVTGDGLQERDFVHVYDVCACNIEASNCDGPINDAFNVGSGTTMSVLDLAKMISDKYEFIEERKGEARITHADVSKAKKVLKWEPKRTLKDYIQEEVKKIAS